MARGDHDGMQKGSGVTLSEKVQNLRKERAWSQDQLAGASNLSLRTVQRVEKGLGASPETLQALAAAFEVETKILTSCQNGKPGQNSGNKPIMFGLTRKRATVFGVGLLAVLVFIAALNEGHFHFFEHLFD